MRTETLRLLRLRWLMEQMAKRPDQRPAELADTLNGAEFNIAIIARGRTDDTGHFCPTVCCVIGSALFDPWFNQQGLMPEKPKSGRTTAVLPTLNGEDVYYDSSALARFFGLRPHSYAGLVNDNGYMVPSSAVTPEVVIRKIDFLLLDQHYHEVDPANPCPADWS